MAEPSDVAAALAANRPALVQSLQSKLDGLVGRDSGFLDSLHTKARHGGGGWRRRLGRARLRRRLGAPRGCSTSDSILCARGTRLGAVSRARRATGCALRPAVFSPPASVLPPARRRPARIKPPPPRARRLPPPPRFLQRRRGTTDCGDVVRCPNKRALPPFAHAGQGAHRGAGDAAGPARQGARGVPGAAPVGFAVLFSCCCSPLLAHLCTPPTPDRPRTSCAR